ncbi:MAG: Eco57I restriction-modification methylase domain-containing protein [Bacillota bacterium]|nr:Eco57I restriction-modification methylase domain-containing protein [Bacillota bacterium]
MKKFESSFEYKVIYIFEINDEKHKGLLKIGDATVETDKDITQLAPNCRELNQAALNRIKNYTNTAGLNPHLLHTELAVRMVKNKNTNLPELKAFRDHQVHAILRQSNIPSKKLEGSTSKEWFEIDLNTAKAAIQAVKDNYANLSNTQVKEFVPIIFRPEQLDAINKTLKQFKKGNSMLWNAKMRFGKTLSALQVIKEAKFKKTIIITHRPVVDAGWYEDFQKIFYDRANYVYGSKNTGYTLDKLIDLGKNFVYFASIQDLRGSSKVGGKFDKNDIVFNTDWDFVIVDEAHEGTQTALGDDVIKNIVKDGNSYTTKFLALSGTPFNIIGDYEADAIYTWDYIMEQECKNAWDIEHFGDSNPYDELPQLKIYTYNLGDALESHRFVSLEDKAFNFREFFRTWTGDYKYDYAQMPETAREGDFVHESDVWSFLNLMTKSDDNSCYPYSSEEYRELFKHTLWMVPGIKEARALKDLMKKHPVFGSGVFEIVNVAGNGDEEEKYEEALKKVRNAIQNTKEGEYTITLSCGKLTTGVTVKEWTGVFMLSGSFNTSASNYLQTIFRVQSPANINGKIKETSYVFDFAPDRTLKMVASAVSMSTKAGKTKISDKAIMGKFLNYCPVISVSGSEMHEYNTNKLLQQLKRAYAERVVQNGFDDSNLYNDELLKLNDLDIKKFDELKGIIGKSKTSQKTNDIIVNEQGFTDEEYDEIDTLLKKKKKELTEEEKARLEELNKARKLKNDAISILRGISIRMPLLIYGADIDFEKDITINDLPKLVDDSSWEEFMPNGVTKKIFKEFTKYYDEDVFISAGRRIRNIAKTADSLEPTERVKMIAGLFSNFKNPDKETVLTPWRVVNMHMGNTLGGYVFFDDCFEKTLDEPRFVLNGRVTFDVFGKEDTRILEINSKTGLYPLYVAYSTYRMKCNQYPDAQLDYKLKNELWNKTVRENIYVICKTKMAKYITQRTLGGFKELKINARYYDDLINIMQNKPYQFINKVTNWKKEGYTMNFNAIVGNPPYQKMDQSSSNSASPVYNHFVTQAKALNAEYISMIMPARWYIGGKGLDIFRKQMLDDKHIIKLFDYPRTYDVFPVDIAGGICYFLRDLKIKDNCEIYNYSDGVFDVCKRPLNEFDVLIRSNKALGIVKKVMSKHDGIYMDEVVSVRKPFGLPTNYKPKEKGIPCQFIQKIGMKFASSSDVDDPKKLLDKWKFIAPKAPIAGQTDFTKPVGIYYGGNTFILPPGTCCTESFIVLYACDTEEEIECFKSYMLTKITRFLLLQCVASQDITREKFKFVPCLSKFDRIYTDEYLCNFWGITEDEWNYIDSRINNIKGN